MRRILIIIIFFGTVISTIRSQDITVTSALDTSHIFIGDQINYTVTVEQPSGLKVMLKPVSDTLCKNIEIIAGPVTDTISLPGNRLKRVTKYLVTSFDSGFYEVPPFYAEIQNESGIRRFYSDYNFLEVMRVKIAPQDTSARIYDIIEPYKAPVTLGEILPWILLAAAAAAVVWGGLLLWRRIKRKKGADGEIINTEPSHVIAFRELEKLKEQQLWQRGEVKQYYSRLTEIIRQYLENRFGVFSLEMTTSETLDELLKTGFKKDNSFMMLKAILTGSDLVKFAKYKPEPVENEQHFLDSWQFVDITRIREVEPDSTMEKGKEEDKS